MKRLLLGILLAAAFASSLCWAAWIVVQILRTLPWQVLVLAAACLALIGFAAWLTGRTEARAARRLSERREKGRRLLAGEREINERRAQTEGMEAHAKGAWSASAALPEASATDKRGAPEHAGPGLRFLRGGR